VTALSQSLAGGTVAPLERTVHSSGKRLMDDINHNDEIVRAMMTPGRPFSARTRTTWCAYAFKVASECAA
jgi:hypothetical protein